MIPLRGLTAAVHTPFDAQRELALAAVERQAERLLADGVNAAYVAGTTGESHSLTVAERLALAERWIAVARGTPLRVVVHVGTNCLADAKTLAAAAQQAGAAAIAAVAPSYFKPASLADLVECCRAVAAAAPGLPFYYYDIPSMTGLALSVPEFLGVAAERVPTLEGVKFSNPDLLAYQRCLRAEGGRFDMPWGFDEWLLAALSLGAVGAVGSSYNFAAPVSVRLMAAFEKGDLHAARGEQYRSARLVHALAAFGYLSASKAVMELLGVPVGPPRLPLAPLPAERREDLRATLDAMGFFDWRGPPA